MKISRFLVVTALTAGLATGFSQLPTARAAVPETREPIKLVIMGYSGDNIIMYIYGQLIEKLGYNVEYTPADYLGQFAGLESGDLHIGSPGWDTTAKAVMTAAWKSGKVLNMGNMGIAVTEDWWYPLYVKKVCPGLPDWKALLKPRCAKALSVVETAPKARFLSGPIEWGGHDAERVEALGLPFEVINAGSDGALTAEFVAAIKRKQPIIGWTWEPFWLAALYPGEFVQWPKYEDACYEDRSWGLNKAKAYDCGRPKGFMWKSAWAGGESKWRKAYKVWRKFQLDAKEIGDMVYKSDIDGVDTKVVAKQWVAENENTWKRWLK